MNLQQTKNVFYGLYIAFVVCTFLAAFNESLLFLILTVCCVIAIVAVSLLFWRCPHCGRGLGRYVDRFCTHCGGALEE